MDGKQLLEMVFQCIDAGAPAFAPTLKNFVIALVNNQKEPAEQKKVEPSKKD